MDLPGARGMSSEAVAGTVLIIANIPNLYSSVLPSWFTISSPFFNDQGARSGNVKRIRQGEVVASIEALAIGWAGSKLFGSPLPLYASAVMVAIQIVGYEYALSHPATEEATEEDLD